MSCPWEHRIEIDEETGLRHCVEVCAGCGDIDFCTDPEHPHSEPPEKEDDRG